MPNCSRRARFSRATCSCPPNIKEMVRRTIRIVFNIQAQSVSASLMKINRTRQMDFGEAQVKSNAHSSEDESRIDQDEGERTRSIGRYLDIAHAIAREARQRTGRRSFLALDDERCRNRNARRSLREQNVFENGLR